VATGDIKATRLVIYGALLAVLDPVLTLAAAGDLDGAGTRMPTNDMLMQSTAAATAGKAGEDSSTGTPTSSTDGEKATGLGAGMRWSKGQFGVARNMQDRRRLELAGQHISDHAVVLGAYEVTVSAAASSKQQQWALSTLLFFVKRWRPLTQQ
jgi:hypothetical protein